MWTMHVIAGMNPRSRGRQLNEHEWSISISPGSVLLE